jgi:DNA-binding transcriptional MerR regulator
VARQGELTRCCAQHGTASLLFPTEQALLLRRLRLSAAASARLLGVSERRFLRWVEEGLVPPAPDGDGFDAGSLERALKLQALLAAGLSLTEAAAQLLAEQPAPVQPSHLALRLEQRLRRLEQAAALARYSQTPSPGAPACEALQLVQHFFDQFPYAFDTAEGLALRLGVPPPQLHAALETLVRRGVLARRRGPDYVYARARPVETHR